MESLFTTRDSEEHKLLKRPVAQWYSMTSIRSLEYLVDPCSHLFTDAMTDLQGEVIDLGTWVQWYAFDVIGAITFGSRFGFMETRKDVQGVINGIEVGLTYCGVIGQIPVLHKFLLGNMIVRKVLGYLMGGKGDPMPTVEKVSDHRHFPGAERSNDDTRWSRIVSKSILLMPMAAQAERTSWPFCINKRKKPLVFSAKKIR